MAEDAAAEQPKKKKRSRMTMTLALVVGVAIVEGIGFYAATKMFGGGPQVAYGGDEGHLLAGEEPGAASKTVEIELLKKFKVPNDKRGRLYVYDFDVVMKVPSRRQEEARQLVTERQGEISDRIARIVRAADPAILHEPELKTLRMQIKHTVGGIAGDQDMVIEVLIPRCVPIRSD